MTPARLPSETAVDRTDPLDRPPEIASALAGAELALPYLLESDDVASFARIAAAGAPRAPVAPPMLPLLVAALWRTREQLAPRGLVLVVDDDEAAHALAESAAPYLPGAAVAYLPSRGAAYGSGLEPAAHLVGERALALDALAQGGLVAVSADALVERITPLERRPAVVELDLGAEPGFDRVVEVLAAGGGGVRARRHGRGARQLLGAGRDHRRVPDHGPRTDPGRVLRRRDRAPVGLLGLHPALLARARPRRRVPRGRARRPRAGVGRGGGRAGDPGRPGGARAGAGAARRGTGVEPGAGRGGCPRAQPGGRRSPARPAAAVARVCAAAGGRGAGGAKRRARGAAAGPDDLVRGAAAGAGLVRHRRGRERAARAGAGRLPRAGLLPARG